MSRAGVAAAAAVGVGIVGRDSRTAQATSLPLSGAYFTAFGRDSGYSAQPSIGFDASDALAGFRLGVSGFGSGAGVVGVTTGGGSGVAGQNSGTDKKGAGVTGVSTSGAGVRGSSQLGSGVVGSSTGGNGVEGSSTAGIGVYATTRSASHPALAASNPAAGEALRAWSGLGRGAIFSGSLAQIQLSPSHETSHPTTGEAGDLFVDRFHRLWYCHNGGHPATWKQLA